eukprot:TRINITY_DN29551_c0_g3_i1.p1 TRINITY_DN29551_c0_g3~~TRINITY_DN29551_c0_g3_i1.p1  ORF type:complete len:254 (+),score=64.43 TRINITY_DN29551_c0_g3_i1:115-876(+)
MTDGKSMEPWKKAVALAAGAVGVAGVLYYLLSEDGSDEDKKSLATAGEGKKIRVEESSIEQVQQILDEIVNTQEVMRGHMKDLTKELLSKKLDFDQTYQRVKDVQPDEVLEKYNLSMTEFDALLSKYQHDPKVKEGIARFMGAQPAGSSQSAVKVNHKQIIDVHAFMLEELEKLVKHFSTIKDKASYDMKTVTLTAQAIVAGKVEEKFGLTSEDIERGVVDHHNTLATDLEFATVNMKMQQAMHQLMGSPMFG